MNIKELRDLIAVAEDIEQRTLLDYKLAKANLEMLRAKLEKDLYELKKGTNGTD